MALNRNQAVLTAILNRLQEAENAAWTLLTSMSIEAAANDLLDKIGKLVGEPRIGRSDDEYRAGVRLKVRSNISSGRAVDVLDVAALACAASLTPTLPVYIDSPPAAFVIELWNIPGTSAPYIADKLRHVRPAGVQGLVQYTNRNVGGTPASLILDSASGGVTSPLFLDSVSGGVSPNAGALSVGVNI